MTSKGANRFMSVQSFTITVPQSILDDLRERLARTRWPDEPEGAGWDYGTNLAYLKELVSYWQHDFDWRVQEAKLNQFTQFRTQINGLGVHFVHQRGKGPNPLPLLLTHGWPDSFYLCWLLSTSVQAIGLLYLRKEAFLPKYVRCEYNQHGPCCAYALDHAPIFTKKRFYLCCVCFPRSSNASASAFMCSKNVFCVGSNRR